MWKLSTGVIAEEMHNFEQEKTNSEEQEGCRRGSRGTNNQLLIDKTVVKDCKKRNTDWRAYKKAYDFVPHSYINERTESLGITDNTRGFWKEQRAVEVIADF